MGRKTNGVHSIDKEYYNINRMKMVAHCSPVDAPDNRIFTVYAA